MAEGVRVHETRPGRGRHRPMETGDRRPVARAYGGASGDRGGRGGLRAQPHAGTGAPEVRPRRLTPDGVGLSAAAPLIPAPRWRGSVVAREPWRMDPAKNTDIVTVFRCWPAKRTRVDAF